MVATQPGKGREQGRGRARARQRLRLLRQGRGHTFVQPVHRQEVPGGQGLHRRQPVQAPGCGGGAQPGLPGARHGGHGAAGPPAGAYGGAGPGRCGSRLFRQPGEPGRASGGERFLGAAVRCRGRAGACLGLLGGGRHAQGSGHLPGGPARRRGGRGRGAPLSGRAQGTAGYQAGHHGRPEGAEPLHGRERASCLSADLCRLRTGHRGTCTPDGCGAGYPGSRFGQGHAPCGTGPGSQQADGGHAGQDDRSARAAWPGRRGTRPRCGDGVLQRAPRRAGQGTAPAAARPVGGEASQGDQGGPYPGAQRTGLGRHPARSAGARE